MQRTTIAFPDSLPPLAGAETPFAKILVVRSFRLLRLVRVNHSDLGSFRSEKSKKNHCRKGEWFTVERLVMTIWLTCPYECYQLPMLPQGNTNATHVPHRLALGLWLAHIWQCHAVDLLYPLTDLVHLRMFRHWIIGSSFSGCSRQVRHVSWYAKKDLSSAHQYQQNPGAWTAHAPLQVFSYVTVDLISVYFDLPWTGVELIRKDPALLRLSWKLHKQNLYMLVMSDTTRWCCIWVVDVYWALLRDETTREIVHYHFGSLQRRHI